MTNLILHIGTTKTGTSSLQHLLASSCELLHQKYDVSYPIPQKLIKLVKEDKTFIGGGNFPKQVLKTIFGGNEELAVNALETFFQTIVENRASTTILSSEALLGLSRSQQACDLVYSVSRKFFKSIKIVCVVRPPLDHTVSQYAEFCKRRKMTQTFDQGCLRVFLDIGKYLQPFYKAFDHSYVKVIPYTKANNGKTLINSILETIDDRLICDDLLDREIDGSKNINRSMSVLECEAACKVNKILKKFKLNRVLFVLAYNQYMIKNQRDSLLQFHHLSQSSHDNLLQLSEQSLSSLFEMSGIVLPFASPGLAESMMNTPSQKTNIQLAKYNEIVNNMLDEILN